MGGPATGSGLLVQVFPTVPHNDASKRNARVRDVPASCLRHLAVRCWLPSAGGRRTPQLAARVSLPLFARSSNISRNWQSYDHIAYFGSLESSSSPAASSSSSSTPSSSVAPAPSWAPRLLCAAALVGTALLAGALRPGSALAVAPQQQQQPAVVAADDEVVARHAAARSAATRRWSDTGIQLAAKPAGGKEEAGATKMPADEVRQETHAALMQAAEDESWGRQMKRTMRESG